MKLSFLFLLSVSSLIGANDEERAQGYEVAGVCAYYPKVHKTNALTEACDVYCANQPNSKMSGCDLGKGGVQANGDVSEVAWKEHRQDKEGDLYVLAPCFCESEVVDYIVENVVEVVAEGLKRGFEALGRLFCNIGLSVLETIADAGLAAIPGTQELLVAKYAVKAAKTFAENGLAAADYMDWIGKACGNPPGYNPWEVLLTGKNPWDNLVTGPDDMGKSEGCLQKNKKGCKSLPPPKKLDPPKSKQPDTPKPKKTDTPKPEKDRETPKPNTKADSPKPKTTTQRAKPTSRTSHTSTPSRSPTSTSDACPLQTGNKLSGRGTDECGDDCWEFSNAVEAEGVEDVDLVQRDLHHDQLQKRGREATKVCPDYGSFTMTLHNYPENKQVESLGLTIFDFSGHVKPLDKSWYDLTTVKNMKVDGKNRKVAIEHILEWQMLRRFLEHDLNLKDKSICAHIQKFYMSKVNIDTKVSVKDKDGKFKDVAKKTTEDRAIDWVAHQYPGTAFTGSHFGYEFVALSAPVNGKKALLWGDKSLVVAPQGKAPYTGNQANKKSMELLVYNKATKGNAYNKNEGYCNSIKALRDVIGVWKYHTEPEVAEYFKAQILRIGDAFDYLETKVLNQKGMTFTANSKDKYKAIGLKKKWEDWMSSEIDDNIERLEAFIEKWTKELRKEKTKIKRREMLDALHKRAPAQSAKDKCGQEKDKKKLKMRIDLVLGEWDEAKKRDFKNPLEKDGKKTPST